MAASRRTSERPPRFRLPAFGASAVTDRVPDPLLTPTTDAVPQPLDVALRRLTVSANHGRLWIGLAAAGALAGGRFRRAGLRGLVSLGGASLVTNALLKPFFGRRRPDVQRTALARQLHQKPWTSSFPSGHAASAAAFATGAALELPATAAVIAPLAGAVAYSRVHVGVHYRSDVIVGAAVGIGVAAAGRALWPVRPAQAATTTEAEAPALPQGRGLVVVVNAKSGSSEESERLIREALPEARIVAWDPGDDAPDLAGLLAEHPEAKAYGVAGGDGTVASVAGLAHERQLPLAVFPGGTLNHFAKALGLTDVDIAAAAVDSGTAGGVDLALLDGIPFLNTASVGGYPELVLLRDRLSPRIGKWPAAALAAWRVLKRADPMDVELNGTKVRIWALFVGNGHYTPRGLSASWRDEMCDGLLDAQWVRADRPFSRFRAVTLSFLGLIQHSKVYGQVQTERLQVRMLDASRSVAHDGEVAESREEFIMTVAPRRLTVYRP